MTAWADTALRHLDRHATIRGRLVGLALLRVLTGLYAAHFLLADYSRRAFFWGPHGMLPYRDFLGEIQAGQFSVLAVSSASWYFQLVYHLSVLVVVAFTVCGGRTLTVLLAVVLWSFGLRNWEMLQGGDVLAKILVIFLAFTTTDAYLSPWAARRRQRLALARGRRGLGTVLHNAATFLIVFQVVTVYFVAGLLKLQGARWLDGTAMYYVAHVPQYSFFAPFTALTSHGSVTTLISYGTLALEVGFPVIVLARGRLVREAGVLSAEAMHVGIIGAMGLVRFGLIMIGADAVCLRDDDYRALRAQLGRAWRRLRTSRPLASVATARSPRSARSAADAADDPERAPRPADESPSAGGAAAGGATPAALPAGSGDRPGALGDVRPAHAEGGALGLLADRGEPDHHDQNR